MDLAQILIVEDEPVVALSIQNRLQGLGYGITGVASSAHEALECAVTAKTDLVLMDIRLKGDADGVAAAGELKSRHDIPVVFLTAYADDATLARARSVSPAGYLLKPFETKELQTAIEIALQRHNLERKLRASQERYELASRGANDGIWDWDLLTNEVYYSHRWKAIVGAAEADIGTESDEWLSRVHPQDLDRVRRDLARHLDGITTFFENEHRILHKDGTFRWVFCRGMAVRDAEGRPFRIAGSQSDVTRRRLAEDRLIQFAFFDPLTDLPNQVGFFDRLWGAVRHRKALAGEQEASMFTAMIELCGLPGVAGGISPMSANSIIVQAARRLEKTIQQGHTLARLEGGRFAVLMPGASHEEMQDFASRIRRSFEQPFLAEQLEIFVVPAIGYVDASESYDKPEDLVRQASEALDLAVQCGQLTAYRAPLTEQARLSIEAASRVNRAIVKNEWAVFYQPVVRLIDGRVIEMEALIRWRDPVWGILPPEEIFPVVRSAGAFARLQEFAYDAAIKWFAVQCTDPDCRLALNASPDFTPDFADLLLALMQRYSLDPARVAVHVPGAQLESTFRALDARPLALSSDGMTPLRSLHAVKPGWLNMDVSGLNLSFASPQSRLVEGALELAHEAGWKTVAKRLEGRDQIPAIRRLGFSAIQGYAVEKPMPADQAVRWVKGMKVSLP